MESPPPQLVAPPPKRKRKIRRVLCAIRDLIERLLTPTAIVVIAVLLLVASWIYPPWVSYGRYPQHDWYFIFSTRTGPMRIDLARLLLIDLIIAVPSALLAWAISRNSAARRIAAWIVFYSIVYLVLALPTVGIVWGGAVLIQNVQQEVAKRAIQTKRFDPATATLVEEPKRSKASPYDVLLAVLPNKRPVTVEIPGHGIAEFPAGMSDDEISAVIKKKFFSGEPWKDFDPLKAGAIEMVAPNDLKKITLFDVGITGSYIRHTVKGRFESYATCTGFHGTLRNDLPRAVEKIGVKASFYNAQGELIEVRTFWLQLFLTGNINAPVSFNNENDVSVDRLPDGWTYQLEVIEAQYVK